MSKFSKKDIIDILAACKSSGVRKFDLDGLKLEFDAPGVELPRIQLATEAPELERRRFAMMEADVRQQQLDELMATDPEKYEELIASGELTAPEEDTDAYEANSGA